MTLSKSWQATRWTCIFADGIDKSGRPFVAHENYPAALTLFLFPAVAVELLTGNTSLASFLRPGIFLVLTMIYGGAVLLIRETVVRWDKGFASILVLAGGYGMVNEGLCSKGFFDPHFYAVAASGLAGYGRWFGINVPWALSMSVFHAAFSVIAPLVIVSAIFPGRQRWIGGGLYSVLLAAFAATIAFAFEVSSPISTHYRYDEGRGPIALVLLLVVLDILIAWKLPASGLRRWQVRLRAPALFVLGAVFALAFFAASRIVHAVTSPFGFLACYLALFVALPVWLLLKLPEASSRGKVALAAGLLVPLLAAAAAGGAGRLSAAVVVVVLLAIALVSSAHSMSAVVPAETPARR